ncbi:hypothetical protein A3736_10690 [Erythrobacter sp. HI0063]|uniref:hypothetical protein n=1 Tax=Erythrobacter sp. HI0063 TaxID=1822240 RepID=UPI0007C399BF|nr:hypothetical protein [Erythrobacter sp. HI0063]KZY55556.1 hypothetical protein A3736_10690 [Erythrobacter sp. HI0063]
MRSLVARVEALERKQPDAFIRPVLLVCPGNDPQALLADWFAKNGPCDAEPLFVHLVGVKPDRV